MSIGDDDKWLNDVIDIQKDEILTEIEKSKIKKKEIYKKIDELISHHPDTVSRAVFTLKKSGLIK